MRFGLLLTLLLSTFTYANPRPLAMTYPYQTVPKDGLEVEQFVDLTPVRTIDTTGELTWAPLTELVTEIEYGLTDRLELGLYLQLSNDPAGSTGTLPLGFDGIKQRLRYRVLEQDELPIDLSLYAEVAEMVNELELEFKINLQRTLGPVRLMANLSAEYEIYYSGEREWVLNPSGGATVQIKPWLHVGLEYWFNVELGGAGTGTFNAAPHHFLGPSVMVQLKKLWFTVAPYVRLDNSRRTPQLGDLYGPVWVRTVLGIDL